MAYERVPYAFKSKQNYTKLRIFHLNDTQNKLVILLLQKLIHPSIELILHLMVCTKMLTLPLTGHQQSFILWKCVYIYGCVWNEMVENCNYKQTKR